MKGKEFKELVRSIHDDDIVMICSFDDVSIASVDDVLLGTGTLRGMAYIRCDDTFEGIKELEETEE